MTNKTIFIPSRLLVWDDSIEMDVKKFILNFYINLRIRVGMDDKCLYSLFNLIKHSSGRKNYSSARRYNDFTYAKTAIGFLQKWGLIEDVQDENGNTINLEDVGPHVLLWFKLKPRVEYSTEHFALISVNDYKKLEPLKISSPKRYWKALMIYCYICMRLGYNPVQNKCNFSYWTFRHEKIADELGEAFSRQTVSNVMKDLKRAGLIDFKAMYVKPKNSDETTKCVGTVVIINTSSNPARQQELMDEAKQLAIAEYIANSNKAADN